MKLHRFYIADEIELKHSFWLHDKALLHQWRKVLRFKVGQEVILFDGIRRDRLYKITHLDEQEARLEHITDFERKIPAKNIYLLWSLLKKDKNDWVMQKGTELGVGHFLPLLADRSEKTGFNSERAEKIVIEASEQCGRSDIPTIREPLYVKTAIEELSSQVELYICEQDGVDKAGDMSGNIGILIGPEGGWSDAEKELFVQKGIKHLNLHDFTLRAETAAVAAVAKPLQ